MTSNFKVIAVVTECRTYNLNGIACPESISSTSFSTTTAVPTTAHLSTTIPTIFILRSSVPTTPQQINNEIVSTASVEFPTTAEPLTRTLSTLSNEQPPNNIESNKTIESSINGMPFSFISNKLNYSWLFE